jgi:hypothetical protein
VYNSHTNSTVSFNSDPGGSNSDSQYRPSRNSPTLSALLTGNITNGPVDTSLLSQQALIPTSKPSKPTVPSSLSALATSTAVPASKSRKALAKELQTKNASSAPKNAITTFTPLAQHDDNNTGIYNSTESSNNTNKKPLACDRCRAKKRKCDGNQPCNNCQKANQRIIQSGPSATEPLIECQYAPTTKKRGRKKGYREVMSTKIHLLESILKPLQENGLVPLEALEALKNIEKLQSQHSNSHASEAGGSGTGSSSTMSAFGTKKQKGNAMRGGVLRSLAHDQMEDSDDHDEEGGEDEDDDLDQYDDNIPGTTFNATQSQPSLVDLINSDSSKIPFDQSRLSNADINNQPAITSAQALEALLWDSMKQSGTKRGAPGPKSPTTAALEEVFQFDFGQNVQQLQGASDSISSQLVLSPRLRAQANAWLSTTPVDRKKQSFSMFPDCSDWTFPESIFTSPSPALSFSSNLSHVQLSGTIFQESLHTLTTATLPAALHANVFNTTFGANPFTSFHTTPVPITYPTLTLLDETTAASSATSTESTSASLISLGSSSSSSAATQITSEHINCSSSASATSTDSSTIPLPSLGETVPDLHSHLISLFFCYVNSYFPILNEATFLRNYIPENRHPPALINAMLGVSTMYSQHPLLYSFKFKSPAKAGAHFIRLAEEAIPTTVDCMAAIQAMLLIGIWGFGSNYGVQSYRWIGQACREACKIQLFSPDQNVTYATFRFSVWRGPEEQYSPEEVEVRGRTWANLFALDALTSLVSGLPHALNEAEFTGDFIQKGLMFQKLKDAGGWYLGDLAWTREDMENSKMEAVAMDENGWLNTYFGGLPGHSIFDVDVGKKKSHHVMNRLKAEQIAAVRAVALPRGISPFIRIFYSSSWVSASMHCLCTDC